MHASRSIVRLATAGSLFLALSSLFALSACSNSSPAEQRIVPKPGPQEDGDNGEPALYENAKRDKLISSDFFGKKYDRGDLEAVFRSSPRNTAKYVRLLGVDVYKVPRRSQNESYTYSALPAAPAELQDLWNQLAGGDTGEGSLAGLYFEYCPPMCKDREVINPTILLDEGSDRWTLVHEMMHHNFNKERKADADAPTTAGIESALQSTFRRAEALMTELKKTPNRSDLSALAKASDQLANLLYQGLVRSSFEEIAVEGLLVHEFAFSRLQNVSLQSAQSAAWYMSYSRDQGLERFKRVGSMLKFIEDEIAKNQWTEMADETKPTRMFLGQIEHLTAQMLQEAKDKIISVGGEPMGRWTLGDSRALGEIAMAYTVLNHPHIEHLDGSEALRAFDDGMDRLLETIE